jgi:hypothetical protein
MLSSLKKIDRFICKHLVLCAILLLFVLLRIPNFFEPYWYGDEGIYLTLGTAMRHGERLYSEIIDHKTPLIYYFAMVPTQFDFRVLNFASTLTTIILFYVFVQKIILNKKAVLFATLFFMLLTTLPWFEGHIPNGELFVMFFIFVGATFFSKTTLFKRFLSRDSVMTLSHQLEPSFSYKLLSLRQLLLFFVSGLFFSLGILTKVPALFDALAFFFIFWIFFIDSLFTKKSSNKWSQIAAIIVGGAVCFAGVVLPILISVLYYMLRGSGQAYLDYGLLYNFHYIGSSVPQFSSPLLGKLFTLPIKAGLLTVLLLLLSVTSRFFTNRFRFILGWLGLSLFASLLSNRPYPHYYLQVIPSLGLLVAYFLELLTELRQKGTAQKYAQRLSEIGLSLLFGILFISVLMLLHVGLYSNREYYTKFYKLITHQISAVEYRDSFNALDADNYKAAAIIKTSKDQRIFIWGNNPMLYALSGKSPTGRFTVAFHIHDFHASDETLRDIETHQPEYIVMMKDEKPFPHLDQYLSRYYIANMQFQYFTLWKRE